MVSNDDSLITSLLSSLDNLANAVVNSMNCLCDSIVNTCVTNHITISEVYNDEVILILLDVSNELVLYLIS